MKYEGREIRGIDGDPDASDNGPVVLLHDSCRVVFQRMTKATGGEAYFAKSWKRQQQAFAAIREDIGHLYALSYYPKDNPNNGWRVITVKLTGPAAKKYHVRTRSGYRPRLTGVSGAAQ